MQAVCKADWYIPNLGIALVLGSAPIVAFFILGFPIWALIKAYHNRPKASGRRNLRPGVSDNINAGGTTHER